MSNSIIISVVMGGGGVCWGLSSFGDEEGLVSGMVQVEEGSVCEKSRVVSKFVVIADVAGTIASSSSPSSAVSANVPSANLFSQFPIPSEFRTKSIISFSSKNF